MAVTLVWNNEQQHFEITEQTVSLLERLLGMAAQSEGIEQGEVSLTFVDDESIRNLNREYRGLDKPTDVLSFPMWDEADESETLAEQDLLGDIIISVPTALRQSEEYGHSAERELGFLFVHGFLHLIGYDHESEEEEQEMFGKQEQILLKAGLSR